MQEDKAHPNFKHNTGDKIMCEELNNAINKAKKNIDHVANAINTLDIPCSYKKAFISMSDERGFRFDKETLHQMQIIGETKSDVSILLLDGKQSRLISAYHLSTELETDKQRAEALEWLDEKELKRIERNILKAILAVK
jgi:hypothetical protein